MVVRRVGRNRDADTAADRRRNTAGFQRPVKKEREEWDDPRRQQVEMPEQLRRDVRRSSEGDARQQSQPSIADDVERERVRARRIQKHRYDDVDILRLDNRQPAERRCGDIALKRRMRMVDEIDAERAEEIPRLEEIELGRTQRLAHPPEIPEEAVIVARKARNVIAEMPGKRPRPDDGHGRQQR